MSARLPRWWRVWGPPEAVYILFVVALSAGLGAIDAPDLFTWKGALISVPLWLTVWLGICRPWAADRAERYDAAEKRPDVAIYLDGRRIGQRDRHAS